MDIKKTLLYVVLIFLGVTLWHTWLQEHPINKSGTAQSNQVATAQHPAEFAPAAYDTAHVKYHATARNLSHVLPKGKTIDVKTDLLDATINLQGGNLVSAKLLQYPVSLKEKNSPIQILNPDNDNLYITQSGFSVSGDNAKAQSVTYHASNTSYLMQKGQKELQITLTGKTAGGLDIVKTYTFTRGDYAIKTAMQLKNTGKKVWKGSMYNQITRRYVSKNGKFYSRAYSGAAVSTPSTPYKKLTFSDMFNSDFSRNMASSWIAMQQHYFLSAWVPPKAETLHFYSRSFGHGDEGKNNVYVLGYVTPQISLKSGESHEFMSHLYVGPELAKNLKPLAKGLDLTVDYGWLWPISKFLFWLMSKIHHFVGNWGWSIILVTLLIKLAFSWLSHKSYLSMAKTRELQPRIQSLKDRHGDDKQAMSKAMMELYKKEKINPVGGCLPMLVQIPVFIALYYVLIESVALRQAPFIFWIHDLSIKDPFFILPVLMGVSMLVQQKLSPPPPDPMQAKMMMFLPVIFTVFFATFPAGLVLYWLTNNCASVLQQWYVMKTHKSKKSIKK